MRFPNAYRGVKKIFTAQILKIIEGVCIFAAGVAGIITLSGAAVETAVGEEAAEFVNATVTFGIIGLVLLVAGGVLAIISYIMNIVGLRQAGQDEDAFRLGFLFACFAMIIKFVSILLSLLNLGGGIGDNIADMFNRVCDVIIIISVMNGIGNLAVRLGNPRIAALAEKLIVTLSVIIGLSAVATIIPVFFGVSQVFATVSMILSMVAGTLAIVGTVIYLVFLGKAVTMLQESGS